MPDPAFGSISNTTYASRTNTTVTAPSGITDGDILFFAHFAGSSGTGTKSVTAPSGFSLVPLVSGTWPLNINDGSFGASIRLWYKVASGESGNYTATHATLNTQGVMWRVSAGDATNLLARLNNGVESSAPNSTALSMTTTNNGALVGVIAWDWGDTTNNLTGPGGTTPTFTERLDVTLTGLWTGNLATAGATGDKTFANNTNASQNPWAAVMFVVEPVVSGSADVTPTNASLTITPFAPSVVISDHKSLTPTNNALTITAFAPNVVVSDLQSVTPPNAQLTITPFAPVISISDNQQLTPANAALTITPFAPSVNITEHVVVEPGPAVLTLTPFAPDVQLGDSIALQPQNAQLIIIPFAPSVNITEHVVVTPGTAALHISMFAPFLNDPPLVASTYKPLQRPRRR